MSITSIVTSTLAANGASHLQEVAMNTMRIESNGDADARNSRSSATGLFQFVRDTWEEVMPGVPFSQATDPRQNTIAFIRLTERNEQYLRDNLPPTHDLQDWEVYLAHFSGAGRAAQLLSADGDARLDSIFSADAMTANPHLGRLETVDNYLAWVQAKYNGETYREGQFRDARNVRRDDEDRFGDDELGRRMTRESLRYDNNEEEALEPMLQILSAFMAGLGAIFTAMFSGHADPSDLGDMPTQNPALVAQRDVDSAQLNA